MNIVIISDCISFERFIIAQIKSRYPFAVTIKPVYEKNQKHQKLSPHQLSSLFSRGSKKLFNIGSGKFLSEGEIFVNPSQFSPISLNCNSPGGIETIQNLSPDILITCGAPLLKPAVIETAKKAAMNIHFGVAPYYRGNDTLFWSLYYNDYDKTGGCIHYLTEGVDSGNILAEVYPLLQPGDNETGIEIKTTKLLAEAVLNILEKLETTDELPTGKSQSIKGRNYKRSDRTFSKNSAYLLKKLSGKVRIPNRNSALIFHF